EILHRPVQEPHPAGNGLGAKRNPAQGASAECGHVPYRSDERYFVVSQGRRFAYLFIDPETNHIGTRIDFFPHWWQAYASAMGDKETFQMPTRAELKKMHQNSYEHEMHMWELSRKKCKKEFDAMNAAT